MTLHCLMSAAFLSEQRVLTDLALTTGLMWRCVCQTANTLDSDVCAKCRKGRLWRKDATPPRSVYGTRLEDLRAALAEWFDYRPKVRRPAAISFRVTTEYDDGPAWATWDTTMYFTDSEEGVKCPEDFKRSLVSEALIELGDFDRPQTDDTLRVVISAPFFAERRTVGDVHDPAPGAEYRYVISDYAREAARVLGPGWGSESGYIGAYGLLWGPGVATLRVFVDEHDDLVVALDQDADPHHFTVELPNGAPTTPAELRAVAEDIAETIRANYL